MLTLELVVFCEEIIIIYNNSLYFIFSFFRNEKSKLYILEPGLCLHLLEFFFNTLLILFVNSGFFRRDTG